jgi:flagellar basal body-associated protein FliL
MNNESSSTGIIIGILVVVVIAIVGYMAYSQGYFKAKTQDTNTNGVNIQLGGTTNTPSNSGY